MYSGMYFATDDPTARVLALKRLMCVTPLSKRFSEWRHKEMLALVLRDAMVHPLRPVRVEARRVYCRYSRAEGKQGTLKKLITPRPGASSDPLGPLLFDGKERALISRLAAAGRKAFFDERTLASLHTPGPPVLRAPGLLKLRGAKGGEYEVREIGVKLEAPEPGWPEQAPVRCPGKPTKAVSFEVQDPAGKTKVFKINIDHRKLNTPLLFELMAAPQPTARALRLRTPGKVLGRIEEMAGDQMRGWCSKVGITYPPKAVLFRVFKAERETEIWGLPDGGGEMKLIRKVKICDMDFYPGPKLKRGDGKTPEGFYRISPGSFGYTSKHFWMWMCLHEALIDRRGKVGSCSSFKICIDYPNRVDRARSRGLGIGSPGSAICMHGNCVSAGCVSYKNRDFLPVFALARRHDQRRHGPVQLHVFPFRFEGTDLKKAAGQHADKRFSADRLLRFWTNLREGFELFNRTRKPLKVQTRISLRKGSSGPLVGQLQRALKERGHYPGEVTGTFDEATRSAVKAFQRQAEMARTGRIGDREQRALQLYWYDQQ